MEKNLTSEFIFNWRRLKLFDKPGAMSDLTPGSTSPILVRYRNRAIAQGDLDFIKNQMAAHPGLGRTGLSQLLCELWNWRSPSGQVKEYACRDLLLRLEEWGHIKLPKRLSFNGQKKKGKEIALDIDTTEIETVDLSKLCIKPANTPESRKLWRALMDRHHYLGEGVMCGEHMLYLAYVEDTVVAALGWGAASLRNPKRDAFLGWSDFETAKLNLYQVVNNLRFLILPWVKVKNLGSKILSLNLQRLNDDWNNRYHHSLILAETFVDTGKFHGTVYKASNWTNLGATAGRRKRGNAFEYHTKAKAIYVYKLKNYRRKIRLKNTQPQLPREI